MNVDNENRNIEPTKATVTNQISKKHNDLPIVSLIFGIVSLIFCWTLVPPLVTGIIGLITGCISLVKKYNNSTIAVFGIIFSILGLLICTFILGLAIIGATLS